MAGCFTQFFDSHATQAVEAVIRLLGEFISRPYEAESLKYGRRGQHPAKRDTNETNKLLEKKRYNPRNQYKLKFTVRVKSSGKTHNKPPENHQSF